jgi:hypothetical protein
VGGEGDGAGGEIEMPGRRVIIIGRTAQTLERDDYAATGFPCHSVLDSRSSRSRNESTLCGKVDNFSS